MDVAKKIERCGILSRILVARWNQGASDDGARGSGSEFAFEGVSLGRSLGGMGVS